jgi:hypothetical protein
MGRLEKILKNWETQDKGGECTPGASIPCWLLKTAYPSTTPDVTIYVVCCQQLIVKAADLPWPERTRWAHYHPRASQKLWFV